MGPVEAGLEEKDGNEEHDEPDGEQLALKLHRLGRTCFRKVCIHNLIWFSKLPFTLHISIWKKILYNLFPL